MQMLRLFVPAITENGELLEVVLDLGRLARPQPNQAHWIDWLEAP